jgi:hypothetical protein
MATTQVKSADGGTVGVIGMVVPDNYHQTRKMIDGADRRPKVLRQDGTEGIARKHHLSSGQVASFLKQWKDTGKFISPYTKGVYTYHLLALVQLGVNEAHSINAIYKVLEKMMKTGVPGRNGLDDWERFLKQNKGAANGLLPKAKIWQNARQFVRFGGQNPYGKKLSQLGCVVDRFEVNVDMGGSTIKQRYIRLNTYAFRGFTQDEYRDAIVCEPLHLDNLPSAESIPKIERRMEWTLGPHVAA